jgi:hypothetical protein
MHSHVHVLLRDIVPGGAALVEGWSTPRHRAEDLAALVRPLLLAA